MRASHSTTEVLNDAADVVSQVAAPWLGVLWLAELPLRLLQAHFVAQVADLGTEAGNYGTYLGELALAATAALAPALLGRAAFVRACGFALRGAVPAAREVLRLPAAGLACYVYTALLAEVLFFALGFTLVLAPLAVLLAGLAAASLPFQERVGLLAPLRTLVAHTAAGRVLVGLVVVFAVAFVVAFVNLSFVFDLGLWLAGGVPGFEPAPWAGLLRLRNPRFLLVLWAGATLAVLPYWLASLVVHVHRLRSRQSGEDLRLWFERLRGAEA